MILKKTRLIYESDEERKEAKKIKDKEYRDKHKHINKEWQINNRKRVNEINRDWQKRNQEQVNAYMRSYRKKNKERLTKERNIKDKNKRDNDPLFKLRHNIRVLINKSFTRRNKWFKKNTMTEEILGCTIEFLIIYLTTKCGKILKVEDFGKNGYHIDHIIPLSTADTEDEIIKLCHYTNLQPLWYTENLIKSNKIV